jgi:hypothetical protein
VLTWLVAAVGIYFSLHATSTSRALMSTIVALCLLNGYPVILILWFRGSLYWDSSLNLLGFMPRLAVVPLISTQTLFEQRRAAYRPWAFQNDPLDLLPYGRLLLLTVYIVVAAILTWRIVTRFDRWLDRPKLSASA